MKGLHGVRYRLDTAPIGSGGEGDVYRAYTNIKIAKIYKPGTLTPELEEKLEIMIKHPPNESVLSQVAWPLDLVYDDNGKCYGFIMPELKINAELGEIYKYPSTAPITAQQKISIAKNICVVISEVHKAGYVFGDFNPRNIGLDVNTGLVSFLDTDSYHVVDSITGKTYRCNVCASGYAAPELLKKCSDYIADNPLASKNVYAQTPLPTFTEETDNFALAVHIFKLLMNGYTPFGGIIETASVSQSSPGVGDAAIRRDSYCFKPGYKPQSAAIPMLCAFPDDIQALFTQAFIDGKTDPGKRPNAVKWHEALVKFESQLVTCLYNPLHQYDCKNEHCPLCEADRHYSEAVTQSKSDSLVQTAYAPPPKVATSQTGGASQTVSTSTRNAKTQTTSTKTNASTSRLRIGTNKQTISICSGHSIALTANGNMWAWGNNEWGQLGDGDTMSSFIRKVKLNGIISVSAGYKHTIALKNNGDLYAWGCNSRGQLGVGTSKQRYIKPQMIMSDVASISTGFEYSVALKLNGSLWAWGSSSEGQLGDGSTKKRSIPVKIMDDVVSFSCGEYHTVAITSDGKLWVWGNNEYGQLGDGTTINRYLPLKLIMDSVVSASAGDGHTMAITIGGQLWVWGWNDYGQLGNGSSIDYHTPTRLLQDVVKVSAGSAYSTAITSDGKLFAWGANEDGELGNGTTVNRHYPVWIMNDVIDVVAGDAYTMAIKTDGTLWAWGSNEYGQLGDGTTKNRITPIKIMNNIMLP
ncbi:MAG: hypothetical protein LBD23_15550 [Oscillospiraceae bacterium]|jgi:alpha-tubulin suppressor-like RCC1 family protein|nr:hypothetical protein [Oscillospiraceae bacterium]